MQQTSLLQMILLGVIIILVIYLISTYNRVIASKNNVEEAESAIDVMLKNRFDLLPKLIATVKKYMEHEASLLTSITEQRTSIMWGGMKQTKESFNTENQISGALKSIFAVSENYPELRSSKAFLELQRQIESIEDKIQSARRGYNSAVKHLQNLKQQFPSSITAALVSGTNFAMFEATATERADIDVTKSFE